MERAHFDEKTALSEKHRAELDKAVEQAGRAEGDLVARTKELDETNRRLSYLREDIDVQKSQLRDLDIRLAKSRETNKSLETQVAAQAAEQAQMRDKMQADDQLVSQAQKAAAVVMNLLSERVPLAETPGGVAALPPVPSEVQLSPEAVAPTEINKAVHTDSVELLDDDVSLEEVGEGIPTQGVEHAEVSEELVTTPPPTAANSSDAN